MLYAIGSQCASYMPLFLKCMDVLLDHTTTCVVCTLRDLFLAHTATCAMCTLSSMCSLLTCATCTLLWMWSWFTQSMWDMHTLADLQVDYIWKCLLRPIGGDYMFIPLLLVSHLLIFNFWDLTQLPALMIL